MAISSSGIWKRMNNEYSDRMQVTDITILSV